MLTKEDAEKAMELFAKLEAQERMLHDFKEHQGLEESKYSGFYLYAGTRSWVPVASDIARQIAYKHIHEESYDIKQQLAGMGFTWEEKPNEK